MITYSVQFFSALKRSHGISKLEMYRKSRIFSQIIFEYPKFFCTILNFLISVPKACRNFEQLFITFRNLRLIFPNSEKIFSKKY